MIPKLWCSRKGYMISPIKISRKYKIKRTNFKNRLLRHMKVSYSIFSTYFYIGNRVFFNCTNTLESPCMLKLSFFLLFFL